MRRLRWCCGILLVVLAVGCGAEEGTEDVETDPAAVPEPTEEPSPDEQLATEPPEEVESP